jgi:hypothetical protein
MAIKVSLGLAETLGVRAGTRVTVTPEGKGVGRAVGGGELGLGIVCHGHVHEAAIVTVKTTLTSTRIQLYKGFIIAYPCLGGIYLTKSGRAIIVYSY